jgi:putative ABC transport system ATP-binding protein
MKGISTLDPSISTQQTVSAPQVVVDGISKVIRQKARRTAILNTMSFVVPQGCLFAINGPSGSGKSTLLNILTGIDRPSTGRVLFSDREIQNLSENQLARWRGKHIGIVFQFFQLLPTLTALENVLMALELGGGLPRKEWKDRAMACLETVGLEDYARRLPSQLSGGQQQRVAIARALANNPPVIVADEPTGNLDSHTAAQIFKTLETLVDQKKTVIYVTHDRELAAHAEHLIELRDGRIVAQTAEWAILRSLATGEGRRS